MIQQKVMNYQKKKLFHVEDVPEVSIETLIPMRVLFVLMENIKITIIMMEVDLKLKIVKLAQLAAMLQGLLVTASLKECHWNSLHHVQKQMILGKRITAT